MKTFNDLVFKPHPMQDGIISRIHFDNEWGASVVRHLHSYGGNKGLFELAILDKTGELCYTTSVSDNVVGWLTENDVTELMKDIQKLK